MSLRAFLAAPENTSARQRILFDRLCFDLRMASARRGYALTIFGAGAERDSCDLVLDDGDTQRRLQLKTVLHDVETGRWKVTKRLLRPDAAPIDASGSAAPGLGGGVILAEIDATGGDLLVSYSYTDFFVMSALKMRLWLEQPSQTERGHPPGPRYPFASRTLTELGRGSSAEDIWLERPLFLKARSTGSLLAMLGLDVPTGCAPSTLIAQCLQSGFQADVQGQADPAPGYEVVKLAAHDAVSMYDLLDEPLLRPFAQAPFPNLGKRAASPCDTERLI